MSEYFQGVHFANQTATPVDDALFWKLFFGDGTLTGCNLSFAGYTLTMTQGQLMVCGRQIRHAATQNWAITGGTSGFARITLTVDLFGAATETEFDQVNTSVDYAVSLDGFPDLMQQDINSGGTIYQIPLAVVSLGPQGITAIVSQLPAA